VWDYQTKACVHTLEGHAHNISAVAFHPELPIILTASEDGCIKMWHSTTYRCDIYCDYTVNFTVNCTVSLILYTKGLAITLSTRSWIYMGSGGRS
jgi:WD40 repeat protein